MGNQGASGDGVRQLVEWYQAGLIGEVETVYLLYRQADLASGN